MAFARGLIKGCRPKWPGRATGRLFNLNFLVMGIIKRGILGGVSGKVGTVVGSSWKGISYLRALPTSVANPRTAAQVKNRTILSLIVKILRTCTSIVRIGFSAFAVKMSAFNAAMAYNFRQAIISDSNGVAVDYARLMFSLGNLPEAENADCQSMEPHKLSFTWDDNSDEPGASPFDTALIVVYNPEKGSSVIRNTGIVRSDTQATLEVPPGFSGDEVHCYIGFVSATPGTGGRLRDAISNSSYAGPVEVF